MARSHRGFLALVVCLMALVVFPVSAANLHLDSRGLATSSKSIHPLDAGIFFYGSFGYSIGGGQAAVFADNVMNPNGTASGPLRFALWWTPTPYPSAGNIVATYDITPSLAAGQSTGAVNPGHSGVPFTQPPTGCYSVALVLEENVSGTWTQRDYGNFSQKFDIGNGCITSFTASPTTVPSGSPSTLSWTTGGGSVTSVNIDNGVGSKPANGSTSVSPVSTTTYTLSAFTTANSSPPTAQVTVTVGAAAPSATFSALPTSITAGQSSTLTWTSTNATSVSIDNGLGPQALSGSTSVSPASTTTYTLTATGPGGTTTKTATVTVTQPAPAATFSATPATITLGQSSSLSWTTTNVTSVSIDNGVGSKPTSGSVNVSPTTTTTYTLTATGPGGTITRTATVTVNVPVPGISFSASPSTIGPGQSSSLIWSTTNATSVTIDHGVGSQSVNGSTLVSPTVTTTYTLTATGPGGTNTSQTTVTVSTGPAVTFSVNPDHINAGQSTTLTWNAAGATSVTINNGVGPQSANGSTNVSPSETTTYTLTAVGPGGTSTAQATVFVTLPPLVSLTADKGSINPGESVTIFWFAVGAETASIDQGIGNVPTTGSRSVSPRQTTTYRLTAVNAAGTSTTTLTITVISPPPAKHRAVKH
jgi:hypothetical protein